MSPSTLLAAALLTQAPLPEEALPPTPPPQSASESEQQALRAAEAAAAAARSAAEATERLAEAAERIARAVGAEAAQAPAPAPAPEVEDPWSGLVALGLISLTGNSNTLTFTANAQAEYKTTDWIANVRANGAYGQTRAPDGGPGGVVAENASLQARGDRRFTPVLSAFLLTGAEADHLKSVELRAFGEGGVGIVFLEDKVDGKERTFLRTDLAFRYTDERRFQYYPTRMNVPDVVLFAPRVGVSFRYALNESVRLTEDAEVLPNVVGPSRVLFNSNTKLLTRITEAFSLSVSFLLQHDSLPAEGKVPTDTGLTVGVEVAL